MFRPVSLYIGLRYTRAKRRNHFISFIAMTSMVGIALGITVLITVLSVMNGFDQHIKERIFDIAPQMVVTNYANRITQWTQLEKNLSKKPGIAQVAPLVAGQAMLMNNGQVRPAYVSGINPKEETKISAIASKMREGNLTSLTPNSFRIVLGEELAENLGVLVGDKVILIIPETSMTPAGVFPRLKRFTVAGIFAAGGGFGFDSSMGFINIKDAQTLYRLDDGITGLRIRLTDVYQAPHIAAELQNVLDSSFTINDWTQQFGAFFQAIKLEKTMMFLILFLIIAVAAFNLVSSLVMVVSDKTSEIAILRSYGATPSTIMATFMVQGCVIGVVGTILGLLGGILLANNVTSIVSGIEQFFHIKLLSSSVYYIDYLPSDVQWWDVFRICLAALIMSVLATLYPAWRAAKTQPAEALRYE